MIAVSGKAASICRLAGWAAVVASLGFIGVQLWRDAPWRLAELHFGHTAAAQADFAAAARADRGGRRHGLPEWLPAQPRVRP